MNLVVVRASERTSYSLDQWRTYLKDSFKQGENFTEYNEDYFKYLRGIEHIRELTDSEAYYMRAYDEVVNGVKT